METVYTHDEQGHRVDVHRPSAINPGDYEYVKVDEARGELKAGKKVAGPGGTCHHCGKAIVWRVWFKYQPTGDLVTIGHQCAEILQMTDNRIDHEMNLLKRAAANERKQEEWKKSIDDRREAFILVHPDLYKFITEFDDADNSYINRLKWGMERYGSPAEWQIDGLKRFIAGREKMLLAKMEEAKKLATAPVLQDGRQTIVGNILSTKYQTSDFGTVLKMRVELDNGNKVYGTVPNDLTLEVGADDLVGKRVQFDAKVEAKEDHFGYFSRPTKAKVI